MSTSTTPHPVPLDGRRRRVRLAWAGLGVAAAAVLPPVDLWAARLFSVHMAQHMTLVLVAAPLLAGAGFVSLIAPAAPRTVRRIVASVRHSRLVTTSSSSVAAWISFLVVVWAWHWPPAYDAALHSTPVHLIEHATLVAAGIALWRPLVGWPPARRLAPGPAVVHLATTGVHTGVLGALLVLSARPLYDHAGDPGTGIDALTDQQVAGSLMWVAGLPVFLAAVAWLVAGAARDTRDPAGCSAIEAGPAGEEGPDGGTAHRACPVLGAAARCPSPR